MNVRQISSEGTFTSASKRLALLKKIGVDTIWLMPIYPIGEISRKGSLGSFYSIRDYKEVNREFGDKNSLDAFIKHAHELGLKVILDWVANHTSRDATWLQQKPYSWYERDQRGCAAIPADWTDTAKLNYGNREVWDAQVDAMKYWVENHHVDGFRCDMAMLVPLEFWEYARCELEKVKPNIYMLAEAEGEHYLRRAFDSCYAWKLLHTAEDVALEKRRTDSLQDVISEMLFNADKRGSFLSCTSNHDENSWSGSEFSRFGASYRAFATLMFTLTGCQPLIYTGQEFGYDHSFLFFEKDSMPPFDENEYTLFYTSLCDIHHRLRNCTDFALIKTNAKDCILAFVRRSSLEVWTFLFNLSPYVVEADFKINDLVGEVEDVLIQKQYAFDGCMHQYMDPWSYKIFRRTL
ncbi:MAG: alpha-amylase [Alistipes sp.]|nr:alpha-amylase [Candidatus Alistipes equi]